MGLSTHLTKMEAYTMQNAKLPTFNPDGVINPFDENGSRYNAKCKEFICAHFLAEICSITAKSYSANIPPAAV